VLNDFDAVGGVGEFEFEDFGVLFRLLHSACRGLVFGFGFSNSDGNVLCSSASGRKIRPGTDPSGRPPKYFWDLRPKLARDCSAASRRRLSSVAAMSVSFSDGAIQSMALAQRVFQFASDAMENRPAITFYKRASGARTALGSPMCESTGQFRMSRGGSIGMTVGQVYWQSKQ
jgi:hypothetical protein